MEHPGASQAEWAVFQTRLLYLGGLGGWSDHIRLSLSEYFDKVEATRRLYHKIFLRSPSADGEPLPFPDTTARLKSVIRSPSQRDADIRGDKPGAHLSASDPDPGPPFSTSGPAWSSPGSPTKDESKGSESADDLGGLVAHPALRGGNFTVEQLAGRGLALPKACKPPNLAPSPSGRHAPEPDSPVGFAEPSSASATTNSVEGPSERSPRFRDAQWPFPPVAQIACTPPELAGTDAASDSCHLKSRNAIPDAYKSDHDPRHHNETPKGGNLSRLLQRWKSAESMLSRFQSRGQSRPPQDAADVPARDDEAADNARPKTAQSTRTASKFVRFSDEDPTGIQEAPKRPALRVFPPKKEREDEWLYTRAYQMEKAAADREGRQCRLPPPVQQWRWGLDEEANFSIRAKAPRSAVSSEWDRSELDAARSDLPPAGPAMEDIGDKLKRGLAVGGSDG